jgi:hypothetical protein
MMETKLVKGGLKRGSAADFGDDLEDVRGGGTGRET